jgi:hypothetical protein
MRVQFSAECACAAAPTGIASVQKSYTLLVVVLPIVALDRRCGKDEVGERTTNDARPTTGLEKYASIRGNR